MPEWWKILPKGYWESDSNKKKFLESVKGKFEIKTPSDWGKLTFKEIRESGGGTLLKIHNNSIFETLKVVYSGLNFDEVNNSIRNIVAKRMVPRNPKISQIILELERSLQRVL